jgi:hypothetical protein
VDGADDALKLPRAGDMEVTPDPDPYTARMPMMPRCAMDTAADAVPPVAGFCAPFDALSQ